MAILNDGINGGFRGRAGGIVGYWLNGKWVIRSLPKKKKRKKYTPAQKKCQSGFALVQDFLKPFIPFIRVGFNLDAQSKEITAHNAAKSYNLLHALTADKQIDYTKTGLSLGNLTGVKDPVVMLGDRRLHFSWTNNEMDAGVGVDDQVMLAAYIPAKQLAFFIVSGARRSTGTDILEISKLTEGEEIHTWMSFITDDRRRIATSTYTGCLTKT